MKLYIKNMVCTRCIKAVADEMTRINIPYKNISLGEVELAGAVEKHQLEKLNEQLNALGFEMLDDKRSRFIEKIKSTIISAIHYKEADPGKNFSQILTEELHLDYNYLSSLFSSLEGVTIEKYIILQKIERVKELLVYDELTLSEIAYDLGYSSPQHLSTQFKKVTGMTPKEFKQNLEKNRLPLDKIGE